MTLSRLVRRKTLASSGIVLGPAAWAINTELGQILPYIECKGGLRVSAITSIVGVLLSLAGSFASWRVGEHDGTIAADSREYAERIGFVGLLGVLCGLVFAFALALQGLSSLMLSGCER